MAMELLEGEMLAEQLDRVGRLPLNEIVEILEQVAASLDEAHGKGVVHRDLKPENIFLTHRVKDGIFAKVLDFGIAKLNTDLDGHTVERLTRQGSICGTPHYMAPEQIRDTTVDWRADIYALGVLLYRFLAGFEPFDAQQVVDLLTMHLNEAPPPIQFVVPQAGPAYSALEAVALKALAKTPNERYQSAGEMAAAARACLALQPKPVTSRQATATTSPDLIEPPDYGTTARRKGLLIAASALAIGALVFVALKQSVMTVDTSTSSTQTPSTVVETTPTAVAHVSKSIKQPPVTPELDSTKGVSGPAQRALRLDQLRAQVDEQLAEARKKADEARQKAAKAAEIVDRINREIQALSSGADTNGTDDGKAVGQLRIRSPHQGIDVTIGGTHIGRTPLTQLIALPVGTHTLNAKRGEATKTFIVEIRAGQEDTINLVF